LSGVRSRASCWREELRGGMDMSSNVLFVGWDRPIPGREKLSAEHFAVFVDYLTGLQQKGIIKSFEPVFLTPHGGDLNSFFLIRADSGQLDSLMSTPEWTTHMTRALMHLDRLGVGRALTGEQVQERLKLWIGMRASQ
jgi:hypothetical protein